jgi:hypothetical protein
VTGLWALIKRKRAKTARKHGAHGSHHGAGHHGHGHGGGRKAKKAAAAKRVPHPKPRHVAA